MTDLEKAQDDEILTSTKQILDKNAQLNEEEQEAYNQAFKQKPGTLAGKEIKLINEGALKTWSNKAKEDMDQEDQHIHLFTSPKKEEEDLWEN